MKIRDEITTVKWIEKVINSCETKPQLKNAGRLAKIWLKNNRHLKFVATNKGWDNFITLGQHIANAMKAKRKELALAKDDNEREWL